MEWRKAGFIVQSCCNAVLAVAKTSDSQNDGRQTHAVWQIGASGAGCGIRTSYAGSRKRMM